MYLKIPRAIRVHFDENAEWRKCELALINDSETGGPGFLPQGKAVYYCKICGAMYRGKEPGVHPDKPRMRSAKGTG